MITRKQSAKPYKPKANGRWIFKAYTKKPDDPATEYKIIRAAGWNDCIDHLAENNHITCKQNAEKLTDTPEHVKENGNSLQVIEGLDDFLSDAFIDNFTCPDGKNWVCIANHINSKRKLEAGLKAAKAYKELCDKGGKS